MPHSIRGSPGFYGKRQRVLRLVRYPIKIQLPTADRSSGCLLLLLFCADIIIKISPSRRDKRYCCLLSVLAIGDIHTEVIRGISDILRFLCRFPAAARRTGAAMTNEATCAPENPSEPSFSSLWRPVLAAPSAAVIATFVSSASCGRPNRRRERRRS